MVGLNELIIASGINAHNVHIVVAAEYSPTCVSSIIFPIIILSICIYRVTINPDNIKCALFCRSDSAVFEEFSENVLPEYTAYANANGKWTVGRMLITPTMVNQTSGTWQVVTTIYTNMNTAFNVLTFITIEQDQDTYPATLGYYIKSFNSYRITNE